MDFNSRLDISFYKNIATINEKHNIYLTQHVETKKFYVKKVLSVYNISVYQQLMSHPIHGVPRIKCLYEENNTLTVIEEFISGQTLEERLSECGSISETAITKYVTELCTILNWLHSLTPPIIHRDIKPSNIIITQDNHIYLIDFNAARSDVMKEEDTVLLGTKGYAAPEQYGFGSSNVQTDIFTIGMLINTMLWGEFRKEIFPNSKFTPVIEKCTKINPAERFSSVNEIRDCTISTSSDSSSEKGQRSWKDYLPPGFRSFSPVHMFVATPVYIMIAYISFTLEVKNTFGLKLWYERFMTFLVFIAIIFCLTNYLGVQKIMPLCSNKNYILKVLGVVLLTLVTILVLMLFIVCIELLLFR